MIELTKIAEKKKAEFVMNNRPNKADFYLERE